MGKVLDRQDTGKATSAAVPGGAGDTCIIADEFTMPLRGQCGFGGGGTAAMAMNNGLSVALSMAYAGSKLSSYGDSVASEISDGTVYGSAKTGFNTNGAHSKAEELSQRKFYWSAGAKIKAQMTKRGWTNVFVDNTIQNPSQTIATTDLRHNPDGTRMNDPATAYIRADGSYVVINNRTGDIVQVSNRTDPNWVSPWGNSPNQ